MKNSLLLLACVLLAGCEVRLDNGRHGRKETCPDGKCPITRTNVQILNWKSAPREVPAMNLPLELREHNWGGGSCVHASTVMCLRWQNQLAWADFWRSNYSGGENINGLVSKLDANGLEYAYTANGDTEFLDWCTRTRRGAVIFYFTSHSICFVGHHDNVAYLLDNNREGKYLTVDWNEFVSNWKGYGGFALTPIYAPPPPLPYL